MTNLWFNFVPLSIIIVTDIKVQKQTKWIEILQSQVNKTTFRNPCNVAPVSREVGVVKRILMIHSVRMVPQEQNNVRKSVIFFTVVVPALHGHSKVSCLNFSTVYRDSWILTGKTWNNVCAPCKLKKKKLKTLVRQSEWAVAWWFQTWTSDREVWVRALAKS